MELIEAIEKRHSVRKYLDKPLEESIINKLQVFIDEVNKKSGLHLQLVINEPKAFSSFLAHYGKFSGVNNYIALVGRKDDKFDESIGYYGQMVVLYAQQLGLNTCWVALTYSKVKDAFEVEFDEKLSMVIALGYGENQGINRKSKTIEDVATITSSTPDWFINGVKAALLAPTAVNQQKFQIRLDGNKVTIKAKFGVYTKVDLGIVKYHFEIGANKDNFTW